TAPRTIEDLDLEERHAKRSALDAARTIRRRLAAFGLLRLCSGGLVEFPDPAEPHSGLAGPAGRAEARHPTAAEGFARRLDRSAAGGDGGRRGRPPRDRAAGDFGDGGRGD